MDNPGIVLAGVSKVYPDGTEAVRDLSLTVGQGELLVLVGPSGCGKSTTLRMVAGLEDVTSGQIEIAGRRVDQLDPRDRDVAMVFQSYALYPHKTVFQNIAYPLRLRGVPKDEIPRKVQAMAELLGLADLLQKRPRHLSGGQRQRVAMGRALVRSPATFLLDEPLSNLDAKLRTDMRAEIKRLHGELGVTTLYVTHDQVEAMTMGDRVAVFHKGLLQQVGTPRELYAAPTNTFVATVVGSPSMNLMLATVRRPADGDVVLSIGDAAVRLTPEELRRNAADGLEDGREVVVGVRPESIELGGDDVERRLHGRVALVEDLGSELLLHVDLPQRSVDVTRLHDGEGADAQMAAGRLRLKGAVTSHPDLGSRVNLALGDAAIYLFDNDSGAALGAQAMTPVKEAT